MPKHKLVMPIGMSKIRIGYTPKQVLAVAGEPDRKEEGMKQSQWSYQNERVELFFSAGANARVIKIIVRHEPTEETT